jgi:hypothetical protein
MLPGWSFIVIPILVVLAFIGLMSYNSGRHGTNVEGSRIAQQAPSRKVEGSEYRPSSEDQPAPRAVEQWSEPEHEPGPVNAWSDDCGLPAGFVPPANVPAPRGIFQRR